MKKAIICVMMLTLCLPVGAKAVDEEVYQGQYEALELDDVAEDLPESAQEIITGSDTTGLDQLNEPLGDILRSLVDDGAGMIKKAFQSVTVIIAIIILCAIVQSMYQSKISGTLNPVGMAGALAVTVAVSGNFSVLSTTATETMAEIDAFSKSLLPTLAAAAAAAGSPVSASAKHIVAMLFSDVIITVVNNLLMPFTFSYIVLCAANAAVGGDALSGMAKLVKNLITTILTAFTGGFVAYLVLSGVITGTTDQVAIKGAKLAISSVVPVVGSIIADASDTIMTSAGILRNSIGIAGIVALLTLAAGPFLQLLMQFLVFKLCAAVCYPFGSSNLIKLIDNIGDAFSLVLGMLGTCTFVILVSITSVLISAGG